MSDGTLILGGGFGGLATAHRLRDRLGPDHPITVVDRRDRFYVGLRKLWVLVGETTLAEGERPLERLGRKGIRFERTEIRSIDPESPGVRTDRGELRGDHLVVALGAEPRPDLIPGLAEHAINLYDPDSVEAGAPAVTSLREGRVAVVIAGVPYKCPPAPYEAVLMLDDHFRRRGVRDRIELTFTTLQPGLFPNAGPEGARWIGEQLDRRGIHWEVGRVPSSFEAGHVDFEGEGGSLEFDLCVAAPAHRAPAVVRESGLTGGGPWIQVDRGTLRTGFPHVFAIGDVTAIPLAGGAQLPKAGLMAEAEGVRVAEAIAAELRGEPEPPLFDGRGACFLEMGEGRAALLEGDFYREPAPEVKVMGASEAHLESKRRFETDRLEAWLGE